MNARRRKLMHSRIAEKIVTCTYVRKYTQHVTVPREVIAIMHGRIMHRAGYRNKRRSGISSLYNDKSSPFLPFSVCFRAGHFLALGAARYDPYQRLPTVEARDSRDDFNTLVKLRTVESIIRPTCLCRVQALRRADIFHKVSRVPRS